MLYTDMSVEELLVELKGLQQAQQADSSNPDPPYHCGLIYTRLGDPASAVRSYLIAVERDARFTQAHFNLALAYSAQGLWPEAEEAYRRVVWLEDRDHEAWANLGAVYESMERDDDALACYKKAIRIEPREQEARHRIGVIYLRREDWERADAAFEEAVAIDDQDYEAWTYLGLVAYHRGREQQAREYYLKAIQVNPGFTRAWCNLGNAFARMGEEKSAEEAYREALQCDQNDPDLWFNMGEFYFRRNHPEAAHCLLNVVRLNRDDLEAWELLRQWNSRHSPNLPVWKAALFSLLKAKPDDLSLLRELAIVQDRMGEREEALGVLRHLIALDAGDEESRLMLARLYLSQGRSLEAFTHLGKLTAASDDVLELWYGVGQRLLHQNHPREAETCFLTLAAHRPLRTDPWQFLGELALQRGEFELAYERFTRAIDLNRNDAGVWLPLARGFLEEGDSARALASLSNLEEHLLFLPEDWPLYYHIHEQAGQGVSFLNKLESFLEKGLLANHQWLKLAELYNEAGLAGESRRCFARLEEGGVMGEAGELALARYYLRTRDGAQALRYLERLKGSQGENPGYWRERGEAYYQIGDLEEARASFERSLSLDDGDFRSWFNLGNIFYRTGKPEDAHRAFLAAAKLAPREAKVWYNLGLVQDELGMEAAISLRRAVAANRRFSQAWNLLGVLHFKAGEDREARRCFLRCVAVNRDSVLGWYNLAVLYTRMGRKEGVAACMGHVERLGGLPEEGLSPSVRLFFDREESLRGERRANGT